MGEVKPLVIDLEPLLSKGDRGQAEVKILFAA